MMMTMSIVIVMMLSHPVIIAGTVMVIVVVFVIISFFSGYMYVCCYPLVPFVIISDLFVVIRMSDCSGPPVDYS